MIKFFESGIEMRHEKNNARKNHLCLWNILNETQMFAVIQRTTLINYQPHNK